MTSSGFSPTAYSPSVPPWGTQTGGGPAPAACFNCTTGPLDLYIDPVNGNDANTGLSTLSPVQTLDRIEALIPRYVQDPVTVHAREGTAETSEPWVFTERVFSGDGSVRFFADEVWSAAVYTTVLADTAIAGTADDQLVVAGVLVGVERGMWLEFTSGAAVGQRRTIRSVTTGVNTTIIPCEAFGPSSGNVPAPGDDFRVFVPAVILFSNFDTSTPVKSDVAAVLTASGSNPNYAPPVWTFEGVEFQNTRGASAVPSAWLLTSALQLWGVRFANSTAGKTATVMLAGALFAGVDYALFDDTLVGWGVSIIEGGAFISGLPLTGATSAAMQAIGYFTTTGNVEISSGSFSMFGGAADNISVTDIGAMWISPGWLIVPIALDGDLTCGGLSFLPGASAVAQLYMSGVEMGATGASPRILVRGGVAVMDTPGPSAAASVTGQSTAAPSVVADYGGSLIVIGEPVFGDAAALDWDVGDGAPVNKAYYSLVGATQLYQKNLIQRPA